VGSQVRVGVERVRSVIAVLTWLLSGCSYLDERPGAAATAACSAATSLHARLAATRPDLGIRTRATG
jgi:hypothetical protein